MKIMWKLSMISQHGTQNVKTHNRTTQKYMEKSSNRDPTKKTGGTIVLAKLCGDEGGYFYIY